MLIRPVHVVLPAPANRRSRPGLLVRNFLRFCRRHTIPESDVNAGTPASSATSPGPIACVLRYGGEELDARAAQEILALVA